MPEDTQPFVDHAQPILAGEPSITADQRADLWDIFHNSKDANELANHLSTMALPDDTKQQLFDAKKKAAPKVEPIERAVHALATMTTIPPAVMELAEKYPNTAKALLSAADKAGENEATEAQEKSKAAGKGKEAGSKKEAQPLAQPPRADGLPHFPPIPDGHYRVLASDGGIHDIPQENIEQARGIDPNLHVLNP